MTNIRHRLESCHKGEIPLLIAADCNRHKSVIIPSVFAKSSAAIDKEYKFPGLFSKNFNSLTTLKKNYWHLETDVTHHIFK